MQRNIKILIVAFIILLVVAGIIIFMAFRGTKDDGTGNDPYIGDFPDTGVLPGDISGQGGGGLDWPNITDEEKERLVKLSEPVIGATVDEENDKVLYFKLGEGKLHEISFNGEGGERKISSDTFKRLINVIWSYDNSFALLTTLDGKLGNYWLQRSATSTINTGVLSGALSTAAFSPNANRIVSVVETGLGYSVRASDPDGTNIKTLYSTRISDYELYWPKSETIVLKTRTSGLAPSIMQTLSSAGGSPNLELSDAYGLDVVFSTDGETYIRSSTTQDGKNLALSRSKLGSDSAESVSLATLPEKCTFSEKEPVIYCAVPKNIGTGPLPDSWWKGNVQFNDSLWMQNYETGEANVLLENSPFDITNIILSPNEDYIFFTDKKDSSLWSLRAI